MTSPSNPSGGASLPPTAPPTSNNGIYIGIAVALLLGIGVLFFVKSRNDASQTTVTTVPSALPTAEPESKLDDVPPPPPEESAAPTATSAPKAAAPAVNTDCLKTTKCKAEVSDELASALATRARQARRCYETALKDDTSLKGKIDLTVRVAGNGAVCSTAITHDELPTISGCVERVFRTVGAFPKPKNGCVEVNVPMSFVPGH